MSIKQGGKTIAGATQYHPDLFDFKWTDHILNDAQWLMANPFSWQYGSMYQAAYPHLAADIAGKTLQSETVAGITVQFYLADDGHKICPASEESNVLAIYNATGIAWYYIIDTTNQRFKLPRTKFGFTGIRSGVGNYVEAGLPNITGNFNIDSYSAPNATGAFTQSDNYNAPNHGNWAYEGWKINLDASLSSSVYGNSDTVQPKATEMYLYFYVGNFTQTALENTAGLNTELFNGKADLNLANVLANIDFVIESQLPTAENNYTWYRKYKSGWVEQGGYASVNENSTTTINLPVVMADTNYTALAQNNSLSTAQDTENGVGIQRTSTTQVKLFTHYINPNTISASWQVSGMAA